MTWVDNIDKAVESLQANIALLKKQANDNFPVIQKLTDIKSAPICNVGLSSAFTFDNYYSRNQPFTTVEQVDKKLAEYEQLLASGIKTIEETHALNVPIIENNLLVKEKIATVMKMVGIPGSYSKSYYKTNRSSKMTTETITAGYVQDLMRVCLTSDGYESKIYAAKQAFESLKRKAQEEKNRILKEKQEKDKEEKAKKSIQALARMQVKYNLNEDSSWSDVVEELDNKCKYFALARALEDQRNDWSEGFDRVQYAIDSFAVETPEDQEIFDELHELAYDEALCDGRTFRDCHWNYSALYGKVDAEILRDYESLQEYYSKW